MITQPCRIRIRWVYGRARAGGPDEGVAIYFCFFQRAAAAARAIARRRLTPSFLARALPPLLPRTTAALFFPSLVTGPSSLL